MAVASVGTPGDRPREIDLAVVFTVINAIGGVIISLVWPDLDDRATVIVVSTVAAILFLISAWFLWQGNRWGGIGTLIINVISILATLPVYFQSDAGIMVGGTISLVLSVLTIGLVLSPSGRAFWLGR